MKFSFLYKLLIKTRILPILTITLIIIVVIVALLVIINSNKKDTSQKPEQLTLSLIKDKSFLNTIKSKPKKGKEIILIEAAKILLTEIHTVTDNKHKDFVLDDFNKVIPVVDFMLAIDPKNGHAIYFKGEVYRLLDDCERFLDYFQRYLEIEDSIGSRLPGVTDPQLCYETSHGYCEQRTAWISQLLANYYYNIGISESDYNIRLKSFNIALEHIHNVRIHSPTGFVTSSVTMSTVDLESKLKAHILPESPKISYRKR